MGKKTIHQLYDIASYNVVCLPLSLCFGALFIKGIALDDFLFGRPITVVSAPFGRPRFTIFSGNLNDVSDI
jgi:hypothetical protein